MQWMIIDIQLYQHPGIIMCWKYANTIGKVIEVVKRLIHKSRIDIDSSLEKLASVNFLHRGVEYDEKEHMVQHD